MDASGWLSLGWVVGAYLLGAIPFAVVVSRLFGLQDPREYGSKNPGATNVLRSGHKVAAALTLLLDGAKGWVVVWLAQRAGQVGWMDWTPQQTINTAAAVALAVVVGHVFPVFLRFRGGKGVATMLGVMLGVHVGLGLFAGLVWLVIAVLAGYSSLAAMVAVLAATVAYPVWFGADVMTAAICGIALLVLWRHRSNLVNLITGREPRIGQSRRP